MATEETKHYEIPGKIRSFVYLIGMLGFPVVVASYVLIVLSGDLKTVDKRITELGIRIDERPMGLEKTTDFVIYVTDSLHQELKAGLVDLVDDINLKSTTDFDQIIRDLSRVDRRVESYIRPITRRHRRFAERFPTVGGSLGSMFVLAAAAEDISSADPEGYLTGETQKDFGESLAAMLANNFVQYGNPVIQERIENIDTGSKTTEDYLMELLAGEIGLPKEDNGSITSSQEEEIELMSKADFLELSVDSISTAVTALRDQMLVKIRLHSSQFDRERNTSFPTRIVPESVLRRSTRAKENAE